jgi:hypothetical protein
LIGGVVGFLQKRVGQSSRLMLSKGWGYKREIGEGLGLAMIIGDRRVVQEEEE